MKNLHLIATDKPSRLFRFEDTLIKNDLIGLYDFKEKGYIAQHIYITNDEPIKEGDWHILKDGDYKGELRRLISKPINSYISAKIILTTDQDLIKDGVQPIDDEFLEWFVKNPSCEEVKVEEVYPLTCCIQKEGKTKMNSGCMERNRCMNYKIIIPQEEPKQEPCDNCNNDICCCTIRTQETIVKSAENHYDIIAEKSSLYGRDEYIAYSQGVQDGVKFQQERMYSEEEVLEFANWCRIQDNKYPNRVITIQQLFTQFKKK